MSKNIKEKVFLIFSDIMDIPIDNLKLESNPDSISSWDSMSHVKLIMQIEHQFDVNLLPEEATEMLSIKDAINIISNKIL
tara:strand:+ start:303 stop:542 length:240 start_codon:yes stop_codon:yes gene_type:complete